jgi:Flp pilus assembly pilin Flp
MDICSDGGQTMSEYALVLGLITLGTVLAIASLSGAVVALYTAAAAAFG